MSLLTNGTLVVWVVLVQYFEYRFFFFIIKKWVEPLALHRIKHLFMIILLSKKLDFFSLSNSSPPLPGLSHLLLLCLLQIPPLLQWLAEVHTAHGDLHNPDGVVFWETVKVVHGHHQRLPPELSVRHLLRHARQKKYFKTVSLKW